MSSHVVISGFCSVGDGTFIGVNATVGDHVAIAADNYIAMSAMIRKDTEPNKLYLGAPATAAKISATDRFCGVNG